MASSVIDLNYTPNILVDTENLTEEEWLSYRRKGIGGSDVAAIMGQSPFCTKRDLYYDKIGVKPVISEEENWVAKEVGHRLEELVALIFSKKTGLTVFPIRKMFQHPKYPFMLADVDFFVQMPDGTLAILECKTSNYNCQDKWANDSVPVNYEYQGRHYMATRNLNIVFFACLFGNNEDEFVWRKMERDLDIEADMIAEEENFWMENVMKQQAPAYTEKSDLVLESIRKYAGPADPLAATVNISGTSIIHLDKYLEIKERKAALDAESRRLEEVMRKEYAVVVEQLGSSCKGFIKDGVNEYQVTYNPVYRAMIDKSMLERLKLMHPDIYDEYVSMTESRRFAVKKKVIA